MDLFDQLLSHAAIQLPEGWQIVIHVERGAGWVELLNPAGDCVDYPTNNDGMQEQFEDALEFALALGQEEEDKKDADPGVPDH